VAESELGRRAKTQAAPAAPLPAGIVADMSIMSDVAWRRCWREDACIAVAAGVTAGAVSAAGNPAGATRV